MIFSDFSKKPLALLAENDVQDVLQEGDTFEDLWKILLRYKNNLQNLYIVYVDVKGCPKSIIKIEHFSKIIGILESLNKEGKIFSSLKLDEEELSKNFPVNREHVLTRAEPVKKAINILTSDDLQTNVLTIVNDEGGYFGKVSRSKLIEKLESMT